jgi:glycosyltransferase involved in cell wall biosynthesis
VAIDHEPVVSVALVTFNHRAFIARALESVLSQDVSEPMEVVVSDDASTDGTTEVVRDFARQYPRVIRPILSATNVGAQANGRRVMEASRGQFLAILEGDDYWTSDHKLSAQLEYLRANEDCSLCFHPVAFVDAAGEPIGQLYSTDLPDTLSLRDFLGHPWTPIHINSVLFRSSCLTRPEWIDRLEMADWPLLALALERGTAGRLAEPMSAYRVHEGGIWTSRSNPRRTEGHIEAVRVMRKEMRQGFAREFDRIEYFHLWRALEYAQQARSHKESFDLACNLFRLAETGRDRWRWMRTLVREGALAAAERLSPSRGARRQGSAGGEADG